MEEEETFEEPVAKIPITASLEPCKGKFFSKDIDGFVEEIKSMKFKAYSATYNYASDYDTSPAFILSNLLRGFCQQLDDKRKYLFVCFKSKVVDKKCIIESTWLTNCVDPLENVIPDKYDDFTWSPIDLSQNVPSVIDGFTKEEDNENLIAISYLH